MRIPLAASLAAAALLAFDAAAQSDDLAGYVGVGFGTVATLDADDAPLTGTDTSLLTGYLKSSKGDIKVLNSDTGVDYDVSTIYGVIVGRVPTEGGISPFAKVGFHRWKIGVAVSSGGRSVSASQTGADLMLGAGVDWARNESWSLRAEYMPPAL